MKIIIKIEKIKNKEQVAIVGFSLVYRLIVVLIFGAMIGNGVQAADRDHSRESASSLLSSDDDKDAESRVEKSKKKEWIERFVEALPKEKHLRYLVSYIVYRTNSDQEPVIGSDSSEELADLVREHRDAIFSDAIAKR